MAGRASICLRRVRVIDRRLAVTHLLRVTWRGGGPSKVGRAREISASRQLSPGQRTE